MKVDFRQISAEELELLAEDLIRLTGFTIVSRPARGPDGGKDLIATHDVSDNMGFTEKEQYLVECKHFSRSGRSVTESDLGNFEARMKVHGANRYLLITTTTVSETVKNQLSAISDDPSSVRKATFWRGTDLAERASQHSDLMQKFFFSWEHEANAAAQYLHDHHFSAHRGAILWCPGVTAVFGNDGYDTEDGQPFTEGNQRTRDEVANLRRELEERSLSQLAFGQSTSGYTWALLVESPDAKELNDLLWSCYPIEGGTNSPTQKGIAHSRLNSYWQRPHKKKCCN